jgi:hypothetical protein
MRRSFLLLVWLSCFAAAAKALPGFTLKKTDTDIFGTFVLYESLPELFPGIQPVINHKSPSDFFSNDYQYATTYFLVAPSVNFRTVEVGALEAFLRRGNTAIISTYRLGDELEKWLHLYVRDSLVFSEVNYLLDSVSIYNGTDSFYQKFALGKAPFQGYLAADSLARKFEIWGENSYGQPNFIRMKIGSGILVIQLQPYLFTNFHLLNKHSKEYTELFFSAVARNSNFVWDEFFKSSAARNRLRSDNDAEDSPLSFIFKQPALRMAFWWALAGLLLLTLLGIKRRQRIIPEMPPLNNSTTDMVRTISDLYYYSRKNSVMARKKIAHWMEFMRSRYNIFPSLSADEFWEAVQKRTMLSNADFNEHKQLTEKYKDGLVSVSDEHLLQLNYLTDQYYKV